MLCNQFSRMACFWLGNTYSKIFVALENLSKDICIVQCGHIIHPGQIGSKHKGTAVLLCLGTGMKNVLTHNSYALKPQLATLNFPRVFLKIIQYQYFKTSKAGSNKYIFFFFLALSIGPSSTKYRHKNIVKDLIQF